MINSSGISSNRDDSNPWRRTAVRDEELASKAWGILLFGIIGAAATILSVCQLRRTGEWFYTQMSKSQSSSSWRSEAGSSGWGSYREKAWRRYYQRLREENEQEMERVERIRRMQRAFKRERDKYKRSYKAWSEYGPGAYQHYQQYDWYWHTDTSYSNERTSYWSAPQSSGNHSMSHHYSVLGLDRSRTTPYSDAEIKTAFRATAMKHHPDQNQDNKEAAEAKFKEVMVSYEAIKLERGNSKCSYKC